jgi:hypothetical protein
MILRRGLRRGPHLKKDASVSPRNKELILGFATYLRALGRAVGSIEKRLYQLHDMVRMLGMDFDRAAKADI